MTSDGGTGLTVSVLKSFKAFCAIEAEWRELFTVAARPTPFLRHRWLRLSWQLHAGRFPNRLRVILVRQDGVLMMAGAFVLGVQRLKPQFEFLASGTPQYHDVLWRPSGSTGAQAELLLATLCSGTLLQAKISTLYLRDGSPLRAAAQAGGLEQRVLHEWASPFVPLRAHADFQGYLGTLSPNLRNDHNRRLRRLAELPGFRYTLETGELAREVVQWCFDSKRNWLARTNQEADWLSDRLIDQFFAAFLDGDDDVPEMWAASLRGEGGIFAAALVFIERDAAFYSKMTHDPAFSRQSPGRTMTLLLIESAFQRGLSEFDLGVGGLEWKQRLQPTMRTSTVESIRLK